MRNPECVHYSGCLTSLAFGLSKAMGIDENMRPVDKRTLHCEKCERLEYPAPVVVDGFEEELKKNKNIISHAEKSREEGVKEEGMKRELRIENEKLGEKGERKCSKCGEVKLLEEYTINKECKLGRESTCRPCKAERKRKANSSKLMADGEKPYPTIMEKMQIQVETQPEPMKWDKPDGAKALADEHWAYISRLLQAHGADDDALIEFHYKEAFVHGYKHGKGQ